MCLKNFIVIFFLTPSLDLFILSYGESETNEVISQGRAQYQLLRERGNLPKYGQCWKSAIETVDEGCRELSEETQSDIALSLTNCFLEMSGLGTYTCDTDKKQNVRQICISSMSDRAFNVYTEFYTHTLNMCWFLRGQIWQETIAENTLKVGKQLEFSAAKQEKLLEIQKESLMVQDQMLRHGKIIQSVLADLSTATQGHQEMLMVMGQTITSLQSWLVGEVSWINTLIFYTFCVFFVIVLTSTPRTMMSRLPILTLLVINIVAERVICTLILSNNDFRKNARELYGDIHDYIALLRYIFIGASFGILIYKTYFYEDSLKKTESILNNICRQNQVILEKLEVPCMSLPDRAYLVYKKNFVHSVDGNNLRNHCKEHIEDENFNPLEKSSEFKSSKSNAFVSCVSSRVKITPTEDYKYNLRSRQNTPNT